MKKLYIIRHAKSSWEDSSLNDQERPLNSRGLKDAPMMARIFKAEVGKIDLLISSPALRAFTTCNIFAEEFKISPSSIRVEEDLYGASVQTSMQIINALDDKWDLVCLFGHNPNFTYLSEELCDMNIGNLPTCGIVGAEFGVDSWEAVSLGSGENIFYDYPKNHRQKK